MSKKNKLLSINNKENESKKHHKEQTNYPLNNKTFEKQNEEIPTTNESTENKGKKARLSFASRIDIEYQYNPNKKIHEEHNSNEEQNQMPLTLLQQDKPLIKTLLITKKLNAPLEDPEDEH